MVTAPEGNDERRHRAVRRAHDLGGDPPAMKRVAAEMGLDPETVRRWVRDDTGVAGAGDGLSDEQRRGYEAFKREVFGSRCGRDGCG